MNFVKNYNKLPTFTKKFTVPPAANTVDKYQDAIDKVTRQYSNSKLATDKIVLYNLISSIKGMREEEADGEISADEASRTLSTFIAKHIGGSRKTRRSKRRKTHRSRK